MPFIRKLMPVLLSIALLSGVTGGVARAEEASPQAATLRCVAGACTVQLPASGRPLLAKLGATLGWSALQGKSGALPAGAALTIDDNLTLTLPVGEITLPKAQLQVEVGEDNHVTRLHGSVQAPFPTLGVLSDVRMVQPALAEIGLDTGANLRHLAAPLHPQRQYLFFHITSGMDVAGKVADTGDTLSLAAPAGQALTLVIDTREPLVYLAGQISVNTSAEVLLVGPLQELAQQSELIPDSLPLRQRIQVAVAGLAGEEVDEHLRLSGSWSVGAGALGRWLGIEATPLAVEGLLTFSAEGMLLDGIVRTRIEPDTVLDGSARLTAFIPFRKGAPEAFVNAEAAIAVPLARIDADSSVGLALPRVDTNAAGAALRGWLSAARQQAAEGTQAVQGLTARGGAWLAALPKPNVGSRKSIPSAVAEP